MCLKLRRMAKSAALVRSWCCRAVMDELSFFVARRIRKRGPTFLAARMLHSSIPRRKPLYWKWMWSTMSSPGCETIEAARMDAVDGSGLKDLRAHLNTEEGQPGPFALVSRRQNDSPERGEDEDYLGDDDRRPLKVQGRGCVVTEVVQAYNFGIDDVRKAGEDALEEGEKRWVVERPLRRRLRGISRGSAECSGVR